MKRALEFSLIVWLFEVGFLVSRAEGIRGFISSGRALRRPNGIRNSVNASNGLENSRVVKLRVCSRLAVVILT